MQEISFENFQAEISKSELPVLLIFYSSDDAQNIVFQEIEKIEPKNIKLCKTDVQKGGAVFASLYGILSLPTLLILKGGKEVGRYSGEMQQDTIKEFINQSF